MAESVKPYYTVYENRYKAAYAAGAECWGHYPDDKELINVLTQWVKEHQLIGKRIIEFACGEGATGVILASIGSVYYGIDIAPSALEKARAALKGYPNATVAICDMVKQSDLGLYDAAVDVMGLHMLVTDSDRSSYLKNAFSCLKRGAPMLFFRESYGLNAYDGKVDTFDDWQAISKSDYKTPQQRFVEHDNKKIEVHVPLIPARPKTREGYMREMTEIGFVVDDIQEMGTSYKITQSAIIHVHRP